MGVVTMGLEDQEQDLEIDAAIAADDENADNLSESPFSPMASRAFTMAVDDTESLGRMNNVLESSENIEDIPESSRLVMETAMESIRSRLLGTRHKSSPALESFKNHKSLQLAIEENKGVIRRVWDAIVKFFKSIYDWFVGFFKKKEDDGKKIEEKVATLEKAVENLKSADLKDPEKAKAAIAEAKKGAKLNGVKVSLKDGTAIGTVAQEDFSNSAKDRQRIVDAIRSGREPIVLTTSRYSALLGSENIEIKDLFDFGRSINGQIMDFVAMRYRAKISELVKSIDAKSIDRVVDTTVEQLADPISKDGGIEIGAIKILINGNNSSVQKPESTEIDITLSSGMINAGFRSADLNNNGVILSNAKEAKEDFYKILNNIDKLNKEVTDDNQEMVDLVNKLKTKMSFINGLMKASTLVFHYGQQSSKLLLDMTESYIAAVALVCEQSLKPIGE